MQERKVICINLSLAHLCVIDLVGLYKNHYFSIRSFHKILFNMPNIVINFLVLPIRPSTIFSVQPFPNYKACVIILVECCQHGACFLSLYFRWRNKRAKFGYISGFRSIVSILNLDECSASIV